ncbi:putative membrane protein [Pontibacter mucosus]|uniref:Putative membrane protein n=1 Tax=Pontibacter mucosus TaxID=1649266 RepID=A0A2T5YE95_9BACT|nr:DUF2254 domain-containing protein [Pontibacter mucosus]PTX15030.1 putative membrane protein [Pontibacter mucosus]
MTKLTTSSYRKHTTVVNSIAFLPSIISTGFFLLAFGVHYFESTPLSMALEKRLPFELVRNSQKAQVILSTLATGTISLTVFSFSMVMIVLSQASNNLTPRVIPGLTTARSHQVVLGFYIGTIIYTLLVLLNYQPVANTSKVPVIAILLALAFGLICLALFVYFIHSISRAIQVDNILNSLYHKSISALNQENKMPAKSLAPSKSNDDEFSFALKNTTSGYLENINLTALQSLAKENKMQLKILVEEGSFVVEGLPLLRSTKDIVQREDLEEKLQRCFTLKQEEVVMEDFEQGVKQISEIAVKALSPGINDPGTAMKAIDFLTLLFIRRLKTEDKNCLLDENNQVQVIDFTVSLDELMHRYLSPIRTYGKEDFQLNLRLLKCIHSLLCQQPDAEKEKTIRKHAFAVISDADKTISNAVDRERLNDYLVEVNKLLSEGNKLKMLR